MRKKRCYGREVQDELTPDALLLERKERKEGKEEEGKEEEEREEREEDEEGG